MKTVIYPLKDFRDYAPQRARASKQLRSALESSAVFADPGKGETLNQETTPVEKTFCPGVALWT
jgi:hypothetical protein